LRFIGENESRQILLEWNDNQTDYLKNVCVHELFEQQVEHTPEASAVAYEDEELTYIELNRRANQLAHYLRHQGIGIENKVGLCLDRSVHMIVGLLAILKAGGAYVPLDPEYPAERLIFTLEDVQAPVLLTHSHLLEKISGYEGQIICLDTDWGIISQESEANLDVDSNPDTLAYVLYTSGSTGQPKGVMVEHRSVVNLSA